MPNCGSQCYLCDLPIRFDTYKGCTHGCKYCFVQKKDDLKRVRKGEGVDSLKKFILGERTKETNWADWNIPLHWGGMSDPFQPVESKIRNSFDCLKLFAETQYPFIVSTKGRLIAEPEYLDLISKCNCAVQISMVCDKYDKLENGCPTYDERLEILRKVSNTGVRTIVRIQPYLHEVYKDVFNNMKRVSEAGAYGVIVEGMKFYGKKVKGLVKLGGDFVYPVEVLRADFENLRNEAHKNNLKFFVGENRLRKMGDSLSCCGVGDIFKVNTFNLNHLLNGDKTEPTKGQMQIGTADCFTSLHQKTEFHKYLKQKSFADYMLEYYDERKENINKIMGVE